ncbi:hypothetical protein [Ralstonia insidiosa]|uniref:Uncharacterized protein n=1 Tax=Ralstonia insidiosa TaxID=190721 RepID=A0A848P5X2_9RALS|nr:hypothetical protein [Ralstonia insidiosa]NMV40573.1 hypothetical protein [Ralstonia insidiosa]
MKLTISNADVDTGPDAGSHIAHTATVALYVDDGEVQFLASGEEKTLEAKKSLVIKAYSTMDLDTLELSHEYTKTYEFKSVPQYIK